MSKDFYQRNFYLCLHDPMITPKLKAKVVDLVECASVEYLGNCAGENMSEIVNPTGNMKPFDEQDPVYLSKLLDVVLEANKWFVVAGQGLECILSKNEEGKVLVKEHGGK